MMNSWKKIGNWKMFCSKQSLIIIIFKANAFATCDYNYFDWINCLCSQLLNSSNLGRRTTDLWFSLGENVQSVNKIDCHCEAKQWPTITAVFSFVSMQWLMIIPLVSIHLVKRIHSKGFWIQFNGIVGQETDRWNKTINYIELNNFRCSYSWLLSLIFNKNHKSISTIWRINCWNGDSDETYCD